MPAEIIQMFKPVCCRFSLELKATKKYNMLLNNVNTKPKLHATF